MDNYKVGDTIAHTLMPVEVWSGRVLETQDCETDSARPEPHLMYRVIDPSGQEDWLCGYEAQFVRSA